MILNGEPEAFADAKKAKKLANSLNKCGELRKLTGRMIETETGLGRSRVFDLDIQGNDRVRQIDHRTIKTIVYKNVLYRVKRVGKKYEELETEIPEG